MLDLQSSVRLQGSDAASFSHEAGFDAWMTGACFARLLKLYQSTAAGEPGGGLRFGRATGGGGAAAAAARSGRILLWAHGPCEVSLNAPFDRNRYELGEAAARLASM